MLLSVFLLARAADATSVPVADGRTNANCAFSSIVRDSDSSAGPLGLLLSSCIVESSPPTDFARAGATATPGVTGPILTARASVAGLLAESAAGTANVTWFADVLQLTNPPSAIPGAPLIIDGAFDFTNISVSGGVSGGGAAALGATYTSGGAPALLGDTQTSGLGSSSGNVLLPILVDPFTPITISGRLNCGFASGPSVTGTGSCDAAMVLDIRFDQAAFDAMMGANTFQLDDFFVIRRSPVPGPTSALLLVLAALGLAARGRAEPSVIPRWMSRWREH